MGAAVAAARSVSVHHEKYPLSRRSLSRSGCCGCHPSELRVRALDVELLIATKSAPHAPRCLIGRSTRADFRRLWAEHEMRSNGVGLKRLQHPVAGPLTLEYLAFSVDGADGLMMVVFTPTSAADALAIASLLSDRTRTA